MDKCKLYLGDALEVLKELPENSVDSVVTDPPYFLEFMGQEWDKVKKKWDVKSPECIYDPAFCLWLVGLTDGEGCFRIHKSKGGEYYSCEFFIKLRADDGRILYKIQEKTGLGKVVKEKGHGNSKDQYKWVVNSRKECLKLATIFDAYPLQSKKARDYIIWRKALNEWSLLKRGNRWHGKTDWTMMEKYHKMLQEVREYTEDVYIPSENELTFHSPYVHTMQEFFYRIGKELFRVLKPGGHVLMFSSPRTYHRMVAGLEDAGFEIRDMIQWLYGEGFPKSMDVSKAIDKEFGKLEERVVIGLKQNIHSWKAEDNTGNTYGKYGKKFDEVSVLTAPATPEAKQWHGWGTALKPACEPIVLARKPLSEKNVARNVLKWSVGGLNVDACRIPVDEKSMPSIRPPSDNHSGGLYQGGFGNDDLGYTPHPQGRFPANVILDEEAAKMLDEQAPNASRFFYCAKAGRNERFAYCRTCDEVIPQKDANKHKGHDVVFHPTVKPLKLMEYLIKLVTPPNGTVLDPFLGTGTTAVAALNCGYKVIGIEIDEEYFRIAKYRVGNISASITDFLK